MYSFGGNVFVFLLCTVVRSVIGFGLSMYGFTDIFGIKKGFTTYIIFVFVFVLSCRRR
jgi:hypothetical protein